jgi:hypothetical protein
VIDDVEDAALASRTACQSASSRLTAGRLHNIARLDALLQEEDRAAATLTPKKRGRS